MLIGITAQAWDLVQTKRGTVTMITSASKTMSVEKITAEISGTRQNQQPTAAFQVNWSSGQNTNTILPNKGLLIQLLTLILNFRGEAGRRIRTSWGKHLCWWTTCLWWLPWCAKCPCGLQVCYKQRNEGNVYQSFCSRITIKTCLGCWDTLLGNTLRNLSLDQSLTPSRWTMCSARAMKRPSLTALISLWMIVAQLREQASSAQILVRHKYLEQEPALCLVDFDLQNFKCKSQGVAVLLSTQRWYLPPLVFIFYPQLWILLLHLWTPLGALGDLGAVAANHAVVGWVFLRSLGHPSYNSIGKVLHLGGQFLYSTSLLLRRGVKNLGI